MKKLLVLLLAAVMCLSLAGCKVPDAPAGPPALSEGTDTEGSQDGAEHGAQSPAETEQALAEKAEKYNDALALLGLTGELWDEDSWEQTVALFDKYEGFDLTYGELQALFEDAPEWEDGTDITVWEEAYAAWEEEHPLAVSANDRYTLALEIFRHTRLEKAYKLLEELGDYEDAAEYLARFTVLEDQPLLDIHTFEGAFSYTSVTNIRRYSADGRLAVIENQQEDIWGLAPWETGGVSSRRTELTYSDKGLLETAAAFEMAFDGNGEPTGEYISYLLSYTYDAAGRLSSMNSTWYGQDGSSILEDITYSLSYDGEGRLIKAAYVGKNGSNYADRFKNEYTLTYDEDGKLLRQSNESGQSFDFRYDETGYLEMITQTSSYLNSPVYYYYRSDPQGRPATLSYSLENTFYFMDGTEETVTEAHTITYVYGNYYVYNA